MFELTGNIRISGQHSQVTDRVRGVVLTEVRTYPVFEYVLEVGTHVVHIFTELSDVVRDGRSIIHFNVQNPMFMDRNASVEQEKPWGPRVGQRKPWRVSADERAMVRALFEEGLTAMCDLLDQVAIEIEFRPNRESWGA